MNFHMPVSDVEKMIAKSARTYARTSIGADAHQEAWAAVIGAAQRFDPAHGSPAPFYKTAIMRAMRRLYLRMAGPVAGPLHRPPSEGGAWAERHTYVEDAGRDTMGHEREREVKAFYEVLQAVANAGAAEVPETAVADAEWSAAVADRVRALGVERMTASVRKTLRADPVLRELFATMPAR